MKIDGNQELCGGVQELHLPECPIKKSHKNKHKLSVLLKVVDPISQHVDTCHSDIALINFEGEKRDEIGIFALIWFRVSQSFL